MATTNKTVKTRLKLRYDTLENWSKAENQKKILLAGEAAIVYVPAESSTDAAGIVQSKPHVLIKIGDGTTVFSDLPWLTALAGDVYDWAKAENKPEYDAKEILGINDYIGENTQLKVLEDNTATIKLKVGDNIRNQAVTFTVDNVENAINATNATNDGNGKEISITYATKRDLEKAQFETVDYLGVVSSVAALLATLPTYGDFARAGRDFTLNGTNVYAGDLLICNKQQNEPGMIDPVTEADWDIIPGDLGGTVTKVTAGAGLTGGDITSSGTISVGPGDGILAYDDSIAVDGTVIRDFGNQSIAGEKTFMSPIKLGEKNGLATIEANPTSDGLILKRNFYQWDLANGIQIITENDKYYLKNTNSTHPSFLILDGGDASDWA